MRSWSRCFQSPTLWSLCLGAVHVVATGRWCCMRYDLSSCRVTDLPSCQQMIYDLFLIGLLCVESFSKTFWSFSLGIQHLWPSHEHNLFMKPTKLMLLILLLLLLLWLFQLATIASNMRRASQRCSSSVSAGWNREPNASSKTKTNLLENHNKRSIANSHLLPFRKMRIDGRIINMNFINVLKLYFQLKMKNDGTAGNARCVCTESIVFESSHRKNARFKDVIMVCDASIRIMGGNGWCESGYFG